MRIGSDYELSGSGKAFFRKKGMLDAHLAHIEEVHDALLGREVPADLALLSGFYVLVWNEVIHYEAYFFPVEYIFKAGLLHLCD